MIATQAEIELVKSGARVAMWLPTELGSQGELLPCPVEVGQCVRLQRRIGVPAVPVTVSAEPERCALAAMTDTHARQQGHSTLRLAREAFDRAYGASPATRTAWVVRIVLGNRTKFFAIHRERYLKRTGVGTTTDPRMALRGEPAVTAAEEMQLAEVARERREVEDWQRLRDLAEQMEALRRTTPDELTKRMLKRNIRNINARLRLPSDAPVKSARLQQLGSAVSTSRPPDGIVSPSPETEEAA